MNIAHIILLFMWIIAFLSTIARLVNILVKKRTAKRQSAATPGVSHRIERLSSGKHLKHTLINDSPPRDEQKYLLSYKSFVENKAFIAHVMSLRGSGESVRLAEESILTLRESVKSIPLVKGSEL